jgi:GTP cyclohydrolase IA
LTQSNRLPSENIRSRIVREGGTYAASDNIAPYLYDHDLFDLEEELTYKFQQVLKSLVIDIEDPNSKGTANRLARMYLYELFSGRYEPCPETTAFPNDGKNKYTGMIVIRAEIKSVCAHHHQPIAGTCYIGLIPNGKVMGLSKYIRLAQWCARRGTLQEELCNDIANVVSDATSSKDIGVYIAAEHGCCTNRGVNAHSSLTQTTVVRGLFDTDTSTKEEFMHNIQLQEAHSRTR